MKEDELNLLANEFFRMFARMEYALKSAGFHNGEGRAEADWGAFALSIEQHLQDPQSDEVREAKAYLLTRPPKKQIIKNGLLQWSDSRATSDSEADLVLLYVRRVRNNLFHGGKFNGSR